jgi:hypothetical protein
MCIIQAFVIITTNRGRGSIKVSNLIKLAHAFGYEMILKKGRKSIGLHETKTLR